MPRLIRRRPLLERVKAYLNPLDFLLWLSEELDPSDWEQWEKEYAIPLGIGLNVVFLIARANSRGAKDTAYDDVFGDDGGTSWLSWFVCFAHWSWVSLNNVGTANADALFVVGLVCGSFASFRFRFQCLLHVLAQTTLQALRIKH